MIATVERTPSAWYLRCPEIPNCWDGNHALHLRDDGRGADATAREVVAHFRSRGLKPVADVDEIAEAQGIGAALRRLGITPLVRDWILMRYDGMEPPTTTERGVTVEQIASGTDTDEVREWLEVVLSDDDEETQAVWGKVAAREAAYVPIRKYLARIDGQAAGACSLFSADGWGRIESVVTHPDFRRRGAATAMTARAAADSLANGNTLTYLFTEAGGAGEQVYERLGFYVWKHNPLRRHIA